MPEDPTPTNTTPARMPEHRIRETLSPAKISDLQIGESGSVFHGEIVVTASGESWLRLDASTVPDGTLFSVRVTRTEQGYHLLIPFFNWPAAEIRFRVGKLPSAKGYAPIIKIVEEAER